MDKEVWVIVVTRTHGNGLEIPVAVCATEEIAKDVIKAFQAKDEFKGFNDIANDIAYDTWEVVYYGLKAEEEEVRG